MTQGTSLRGERRRSTSHSFTKPTLQNDSLFISSISNPSSNDFKPAASSTRQIAMMLYITLYWYFHQPALTTTVTSQASQLTPRSRPTEGGMAHQHQAGRVLRGRNLIPKLERMGLIASLDSAVGTDVGDDGDGWAHMFVSRRMFWQTPGRLFLFTLQPNLEGHAFLLRLPGLEPSGIARQERVSRPRFEPEPVGHLWHPTAHHADKRVVVPHRTVLQRLASPDLLPSPPPSMPSRTTCAIRCGPSRRAWARCFTRGFVPRWGSTSVPRSLELEPARALSRPRGSEPSAADSPRHAERHRCCRRGWETRESRNSGAPTSPTSSPPPCPAATASRPSASGTACRSDTSEIYWVKEDALGQHLGGRDADDWDRGFHLFVGEEWARGRVQAWLTSLAHWIFAVDYRTMEHLHRAESG